MGSLSHWRNSHWVIGSISHLCCIWHVGLWTLLWGRAELLLSSSIVSLTFTFGNIIQHYSFRFCVAGMFVKYRQMARKIEKLQPKSH